MLLDILYFVFFGGGIYLAVELHGHKQCIYFTSIDSAKQFSKVVVSVIVV